MKRKRIRKSRILILLIVIFVVTFFGAILYKKSVQNSNVYSYDGIDDTYQFLIEKDGDSFLHIIKVYANNKAYLIPFRYGPKELEDIPLDTNAKKDFLYNDKGLKKDLYITQDPSLPDKTDQESILAIVEINRITGQAVWGIYNIPTHSSFTEETPRANEINLSIKDCKDVNNDIGVVKFTLGDSNRIYIDDNGCVILQAKEGDDIFKVADKMAMHLLGVF